MKKIAVLLPFLLMESLFFVSCNDKVVFYKNKTNLIKDFFVVDGDTINIFGENKKHSIRFFAIDCPEIFKKIKNEKLAQFENYYGQLAKTFVKELTNKKDIKIKYITKDKYQRWVCQVFVENKDLAEELVKKGLARIAYINVEKTYSYWNNSEWAYQYFNKLKMLEKTAQRKKVGFWSKNINQVFHKL